MGHPPPLPTVYLARATDVSAADVKRVVGTDMPSSDDDPHGWRFDCEVSHSFMHVKVWWVCRRCRTDLRLGEDVGGRGDGSEGVALADAEALLRLRERADEVRRTVHPRCSEVRAVRDVMDG